MTSQSKTFTPIYIAPETCTSDSTSSSNSFWSLEEETESTTSGTVEDESNQSANQLFAQEESPIDLRTDGQIGVRSSPLLESSPDTNEVSNSNDLAFNFISTQSESLSRNSYTRSHDPLGPKELLTPRMTTKCSVVQGYMTLYTYDYDQYENLEARTIDAIEEDLKDDTFVKEHLLNDVVLGVKFVGSNITDAASADRDSISSSPGYVTNIIGAPASATTGSDTLDLFTFPVMILIALGAILLVLIALFVGTSKTANRKRKRYGDSQYGDESSYSIRQLKSKDVFGDYSRDEFDATTATPSQYGEEVESEYFFGNYLPSLADVGNALSRTFSGFSDRAHTHGITGDVSVFDTYETTINNSGGVRIQNVKSYVDEDYEDCYSVGSVYNEPPPPPPPPISPNRLRSLPSPGRILFASMNNDEIEIGTDGLSSRDSLRPPSTPGRNKKTPRRSYPTPSHVLASKSPKRLLQKLSRNKDDDDVSLRDDAFLQDASLIDENGMEVSLRPFI